MGLISCDYTVCHVVWMYESYAEFLYTEVMKLVHIKCGITDIFEPGH
jgi:hypothetical protein